MKENDYIFIKRNNEKLVFAFIWLITVFVLSFVISRLFIINKALIRETELRKGVSVHSWIMSDSCSAQLMASDTLRIKLK